jgi:dihydrofolate reductase
MIKAIFASDPWGGMGYQGGLPWPMHREDLGYFQQQTTGQVVVMGRKTWDDPKMPKPLKNRTTYVVTNRPISGYSVTSISGSVLEQVKRIEKIYPHKVIWVIGGPEILMACRDIISEVHVTHFKNSYKTDVNIDLRKFLKNFQARSAKPSSDNSCTWMTYKNLDSTVNLK